MSGQITRPAGSLALAAALLAWSMGIGMPTNTARADDCLTAPNSPAPEGSHWYYRMDRATQRKCWYVRATDHAAQQAAAPAVSDASATTPAIAQKKPAAASASAPMSVSPGGSAAVPLPPLKPQRASMSGATTDQPVQQSTQEGSTAPSIRPATASATSSALAQDGSIPAIQEMFAAYRSAHAHSQSGWQAYQSLIARQPALDCEIAGQPNTVDADLWAGLKLDYERDCYTQAEILIHRRLERMAADATSNNSRYRNLRTLKLVASAIADPPTASNSVAVDDADPATSVVAPTVTGSVAEKISFDGLASNPLKDAKVYFERGIASYRDGDLPVAIADFDLAIEFDPSLRDAYIDQGIAWYRMGNFHRAFDVIAQAVRIESSHRACDSTAPEGAALAIKN